METIMYEMEILDFKSRLLRAEIALQGMIAKNKEREANGYALAYDEMAFIELEKDFAISDNDVPRYRG